MMNYRRFMEEEEPKVVKIFIIVISAIYVIICGVMGGFWLAGLTNFKDIDRGYAEICKANPSATACSYLDVSVYDWAFFQSGSNFTDVPQA